MVIGKIDEMFRMRKNPYQDFDWGISNGWYRNSILEEIFQQKIYERFFEVEEGDVVVDVGASLGPFTYSILEKNPKHVFCFEPCEEEFPILIKNTMGHPVSHLLKGISSVNGVVDDNRLFNSVMGTQNKMILKDNTINIRLAGDGTNIANNLTILNFNFGFLDK